MGSWGIIRNGSRSSRQDRKPVGGSPTALIARFKRVAMPQPMWGNSKGCCVVYTARPPGKKFPWWVQSEGQASMGA